MRLLWEDRAWEDYVEWQTKDKKTLKFALCPQLSCLLQIDRRGYEHIFDYS